MRIERGIEDLAARFGCRVRAIRERRKHRQAVLEREDGATRKVTWSRGTRRRDEEVLDNIGKTLRRWSREETRDA